LGGNAAAAARLDAGDWLFYLIGGPAVTKYEDDFSVNVLTRFGGSLLFQSAGLRTRQIGYAAGGGIERAIGNNWSVKAEYLHYGFGRATATQVQTSDASQLITQDAAAGSPRLFDSAEESPSIWNASNWEFNVGTRAFFSNGLDGESNPSSIRRMS
jgi:hypothetical protein